ncbi:hypothetical protein [Amaricoccus macauensis]|uniref:hypothetical protein n=1 Tax=Amaricoccus macauensis TaxID=57001 RepID=UPI003C7D9A7C
MRMTRSTTFLAALGLVGFLSGAAPAQDVEPVVEGATDIPVEEWTAMVMGKTLVYRIEGQLWAHEHYYPGTNYVSLQLYDGSCMNGTWDYSEPFYCFHWDVEGTACFRHARMGNDILILEAGSGDDVPLIQEMTAVTDIPLQCQPPIS